MDINSFVSWDMLQSYATFVGIVFMIVQVIKELPKIKNVPTRLISIIVSFTLQILVNIQSGNFKIFDIVLYLISSIVVSLTANGIADASIKLKDSNILSKK
jgi:uncharacterized membrane protein